MNKDLIIGVFIGALLGGGFILDDVGADLRSGIISKGNKVYVCKPIEVSKVNNLEN